jgi:hypothetical protein
MEAPMSLAMTIVMLIAAWLAVASAMLWGVMRISRGHHHRETEHGKPAKTKTRHIRPASSH